MKLPPHKIVTHEQWLEARIGLLAKETEYTRLGDELARGWLKRPGVSKTSGAG